MQKKIITVFVWVALFCFQLQAAEPITKGAYAFSFQKLHSDQTITLASFTDKAVLVVNTASACGFTSQYDGLEKLYTRYQEKGLVVLGVPSNDFGGQESGSEKEIASFCRLNYGVSFPMSGKVSVVKEKQHPFYTWVQQSIGIKKMPAWNFHKILINKKGMIEGSFPSSTDPMGKELTQAIEKALDQKI